MKKLIIAVAIAFAGVAVQASALNWGIAASSGNLDTAKFASGTAYFIAVNDLARPTLADDAAAGEWYAANIAKAKSSALFTGSVTDGAFYSAAEANDLTRSRQNYWMLIDNGEAADADHFFAVATINKGVTFNASSSVAVNAVWNASQFSTYAAAVPEPTSGLLMLLGMAGLALRRRRA